MQPVELANKARILGGVPVWGTVSGSAADKVGLRQGDILLRLNGVQLKSVHDFLAALRRLAHSIELDVLRCESLVRIVVPPQSATSEWIDELRQQVFGRASS
jgi:S1-C subfamily serine protease